MGEKSETIVESFFKTFSGKDSCGKEVEDFRKRVSTYIEGQKWITRPLVLSPTVCSQYGWKCINSNLLECVSCGAKLCTPEPKIEVLDAYKACIDKILHDLRSSHKTHCPWPLAPSSEHYVKMLPMPKEESLKHFIQRMQTALHFSSSIPKIKEKIDSDLGLDEQHILSLCKLADVPGEDAQKYGNSAVCMAATGWTFKSQSEVGSKLFVTCESCQRSIWSESFNTLTTSSNETSRNGSGDDASTIQNGKRQNSSVPDTPSPRSKRLKKEDFDPLSEHRPWCLWVIPDDNKRNLESTNSVSDEENEKHTPVPGWEVFMKSLLRNVCELQHRDTENNPSKEQIRCVRNLLDTWN